MAIPNVVGELGMVLNGWEKRPEELEIRGRIKTTALLRLSKNTETSSRDLGRLAVTWTLVKDHLLKICKE